MAEAEPSGDGSFGFMTHKVGPLPVWMWGVLIAGAYYWYTHFGPGASSATAATTGTASADDNADIGSGDAIANNVSGSRYKSNAEWEAAAINFLVGESVPPDEASAAVFKYLHSQSLSPQDQQDVNLAIEGIGPPPKIPAPAEQQKPPPIPVPPRKGPPPPKPHPHPKPRTGGGGDGHGKTSGPPTVHGGGGSGPPPQPPPRRKTKPTPRKREAVHA